jgi:hypothetical protein
MTLGTRVAAVASTYRAPAYATVALVSQRDLIKALAGLRLALGVASWAVPRAAGKAFGIDPEANPQGPYLARLFGVRDIALAWGALGNEGEACRQWLVAGLACDAADFAAGVARGR